MVFNNLDINGEKQHYIIEINEVSLYFYRVILAFRIDDPIILDRLEVSTNPHTDNTRLLGLEAPGTANHFHTTLSAFRYFPQFTHHHSKGLRSPVLLFVSIRYA